MAHFQNPDQQKLSGAASQIYKTNHYLLRLKLELMGSPTEANKKGREFNPNTFLATIGEGRKNLTFAKKQGIFTQGDPADAVFYIQKGKVKLTVVSKTRPGSDYRDIR